MIRPLLLIIAITLLVACQKKTKDTTKALENTKTEKIRKQVKEGGLLENITPSKPIAVIPPYTPYPDAWEGRLPAEQVMVMKERGDWKRKRGSFFEQWGQSHPSEALAYLESQEKESSFYTALKGRIMAGWGLSDLPAVTQWLASQANDSEKSHAISSIMSTQLKQETSSQESVEAVEGLLVSYQETPGMTIPIATYLHAKSRQNLPDALNWFEHHFEHYSGRAAVVSGFAQMASASGPLASDVLVDWMLKNPPSELRDYLAAGYVNAISTHDQEVALEWISEIQNVELKAALLKQVQSSTVRPEE